MSCLDRSGSITTRHILQSKLGFLNSIPGPELKNRPDREGEIGPVLSSRFHIFQVHFKVRVLPDDRSGESLSLYNGSSLCLPGESASTGGRMRRWSSLRPECGRRRFTSLLRGGRTRQRSVPCCPFICLNSGLIHHKVTRHV